MSWGIELWDRYDDLCNHTKDGIDFLENEIGHFVKERGNIEKRYASELRSLIKKYTPKYYSDKADNEEYTYVQAYKEVSIMLFFEYLFLVHTGLEIRRLIFFCFPPRFEMRIHNLFAPKKQHKVPRLWGCVY